MELSPLALQLREAMSAARVGGEAPHDLIDKFHAAFLECCEGRAGTGDQHFANDRRIAQGIAIGFLVARKFPQLEV